MAAKTWVLTDVAQQEYVDSFEVTAKDIAGAPNGLEISKRTLRGGLSEGVDVVRLNNGKLTVEVLPTRGMSLWKAHAPNAMGRSKRKSQPQCLFMIMFQVC